jgi:hypothetical protein
MPQKLQKNSALVIEPNSKLVHPYDYLSEKLILTKVQSVKQANLELTRQQFSCFILSTSFSPEKQLSLLDAFKFNFKEQIIPLLLVVDLTQPLSTVPGTLWGGQVAVLAHIASKKLTLTSLESIMSA